MKLSKLIVMMFLVAAMVLAQVDSYTQSMQTIHGSGTIRSSTLGNILFEDSFEDTPLGVFTLYNGTGPSGWGRDIGEGGYCEVVDIIAQDGQKSIKCHSNQKVPENDYRQVEAAICVRLAPGLSAGFRELYVSWWQIFEKLPLSSGRMFSAFISSGKTFYGGGKSNRIYPYQGGFTLSNYWDNRTRKGISVDVNIQNNTWHHFEIYYKYGVGNGEYRVWFDEEEVITLEGLDTTPQIEDYNFVGPEDDPNWEWYLPKGMELGTVNQDKYSDYTNYIDNVLVADYNYHKFPPPKPDIFSTSFEPGDPWLTGQTQDYYVGKQENDTFTGGQTKVVDAGSLSPEGQPCQVHSGSQAMMCWGIRDQLWTRGTIPWNEAWNDEFSGGPYDSPEYEGQITIGQLEDEGLLASNALPGTYHYDMEWLEWDGSNYYAEYGNAYPRGRLSKDIPGPLDVYIRIYVYLEKFSGYLHPIRTYAQSTYIAKTKVTTSSITLEIGSSKGTVWYAYDRAGNTINAVSNSSIGVPVNEWFYVEQRFRISDPNLPGYPYNGGGQVWIAADGEAPQLVIDRMDLDTSDAPYQGTVMAGLVLCNNEIIMYVDDYAISTNYIGPA